MIMSITGRCHAVEVLGCCADAPVELAVCSSSVVEEEVEAQHGTGSQALNPQAPSPDMLPPF